MLDVFFFFLIMGYTRCLRDINGGILTMKLDCNKGLFSHGKRGFTLIELLVVVLIIAVLAAVALPQYNKTVEKARMVEAVANVRAIANAHQRYYLEHDEYLGAGDMGKLDIQIPGAVNNKFTAGRIKTKDFIYSPDADPSMSFLALAQRVAREGEKKYVYYIYITQAAPKRIRCYTYGVSTGSATSTQRALCQQLDANGTL